ncbi:MAG TPA: AI-2E family transporter [Longimicrobiales bacterium]|nr:AI-2E family transporter [Longimicrobiales bacterium]
MSVSADRRQFRFSFSFIARAVLVVLVVWALANAVWVARDILFIGFLAILFALFLSIFVEMLERWMPRALATVVVFLGVLVVVAGFFVLTWPSLEGQIVTVRRDVPRITEEVSEWVQTQIRSLAGSDLVEADIREQLNQRMTSEVAGIVAGALPLLNTVIGALSGLLVVVFAGVFLAVAPRTYLKGTLALVPPRGRERLKGALEEVAGGLRRWIGGMSVGMLVIFLFTTAGLWLLGVPAFLALGIIAGLLVFIPFVGPVLSAIPAIALGLTVSPAMALWVALLYVVVQLLESNAITPMVMKRAVDLPPALTILFQMAMAVLFGFIGLVVAVPLLAAARILVERLYVDQLEAEDAAAR